MAPFLKYVALVVAFTSASAMKSLLHQMYFDGYLADRFTLVSEVLSNLHFSDDSCYRFDGFNNDDDKRNRTLACETKRTDHWTVETDTEYIPQLSMRAALKRALPDPEVAKECIGKQFCENVINYNETLAADLLQESSAQRHLYDMLATVDKKHVGCGATQYSYIPKAVADESGKWLYVLNPNNYKYENEISPFQSVTGYHCESNNSECFFPNKTEMITCSPVIRPLDFIIINSQAELEEKSFNVNISCSCNTVGSTTEKY